LLRRVRGSGRKSLRDGAHPQQRGPASSAGPQDVPRVEADKARPFLIEDDPRNQPADRDDESIQAAGAVAAPAPVSTEQTATSAVVTLDGTLPLPSLVGELLPPEEVCIANAAEAEKDQTEGRPDRAHVQVAGAAEPTML